MNCIKTQFDSLHVTTLHDLTLSYIFKKYITLHDTTIPHLAIALPCLALYCITMQCTALHCMRQPELQIHPSEKRFASRTIENITNSLEVGRYGCGNIYFGVN